MDRRDTSIGGSERDFPSTSWSRIARLQDPTDPRCRQELEALIERYWRPVYGYVRASGRAIEDAKDLTQAFFARLLDKQHLQRLDPARGSFRGFLKRSVKNFLVDAARRESARQPAPPGRLLPFDECNSEPDELRDDPEAYFDREFDRVVLQTALERLEQRMKREGRGELFDVLRLYCLPPEFGGPADRRPSYREVAQALGIAEDQVRLRLARCRKELRESVRETIRDYVRDESEAAQEFRRICEG